MAESYPTTCPTEAQGILKAVGGCSAIDCKTYSNICAKCCVVVTAPVKVTTPAPAPAKTSVQQPITELPLVATSTENSDLSTGIDSSSEVVETIIPSTEKTAELTPEPPVKKEPQNILVRFFNWLFRRNK